MRRHVGTKACHGSQLITRNGRIVIDDCIEREHDDLSTREVKRSKPGPKPFDILGVMQDRVPTYDDGDDDRIEAFFAKEDNVRELLHLHSVDRIAPFLFKVLWGKDAPENIRSVAMHRNSVFEVSGYGVVSNRGPLRKRYIRELVVYIHELARTLLTLCLPSRYPESTRMAHDIVAMLDTSSADGISVKDGLERSELFIKTRPRCIASLVDRIEGAMFAEFSREVWTPYS